MTEPNPLPVKAETEHPMTKHVYEPELALTICAEIGNGITCKAACEKAGIPTFAFQLWRARYPELAKIYSEARVTQGHGFFDRIIEIAEDVVSGPNGIDPRRAGVAISGFEWVAGRLVPQEYGDKASKVPAVAIQIITTLGMKGASVVEEEGVYTIEVNSERVIEDGKVEAVKGSKTKKGKFKKK